LGSSVLFLSSSLSSASTPFAYSTDPKTNLITYLIACMIFVLKNSQGAEEVIIHTFRMQTLNRRNRILPPG
jgi:hypothetical protein